MIRFRMFFHLFLLWLIIPSCVVLETLDSSLPPDKMYCLEVSTFGNVSDNLERR